ncbi:MAG: hypothetical protein LBM77_11760 [Spirochaetaceae bacterium]|nr:hypothetical protein [Spirochaetaceae bacterium]
MKKLKLFSIGFALHMLCVLMVGISLMLTACQPPVRPGDKTAPTLGTPAINNITQTTATASFTSDEGGTYYYLVLPSADEVPKAADIIEATSGIYGSADAVEGSNTINLKGLSADTVYKIYLVVEDDAENVSTVNASEEWSTLPPDPDLIGFTWTSAAGLQLGVGTVDAGDTVGTFSIPLGGTSPFSYSLVSGTGDTDNALFKIDETSLKIGNNPLTEYKTYSVRVQISDSKGKTFAKACTLDVAASNPEISGFTWIATEGLRLGTGTVDAGDAVGTFSIPLGGTSPFSYSLVSGTGDTNNVLFKIDGTSLEIGNNPLTEYKTYSVRVQISDSKGKTFAKACTLYVAAPNPEISGFTWTATENLQIGADNVDVGDTVGTFSVPIGGTLPFSYSLVEGDGDTDNDLFVIGTDDDYNKLKVKSDVTITAKEDYSVRVQIEDSAGKTFAQVCTFDVLPGSVRAILTGAPVTITATAENSSGINQDANTILEITLEHASVKTALSGTDVSSWVYTWIGGLTFNAMADAGGTNISIVIAGTPGGSFNPSNVQITIPKEYLNIENGYTIEEDGLIVSGTITYNITQEPEEISDFTWTVTSEIQEGEDNVASGAAVGTFSNPVGGAAEYSYSLVEGEGDDDNDSFEINNTNLIVKTGVTITGKDYSVRVKVTDNGSKVFTKICTFTVAGPRIQDVTFTVIDGLSVGNNMIDAGDVIGTFSDVVGGTPGFTYSLDYTNSNWPDTALFVIGTGDNANKILVGAEKLSEARNYQIVANITDSKSQTLNTLISFLVDAKVTTLAGYTGTPSDYMEPRGFQDGTGTEARFGRLSGITIDNSGNLYVADYDNHRIRKITPAGVVTTLAGSEEGYRDGNISEALFDLPSSITIDSSNNLYIGESNGRIRKISSDGIVSTLTGVGEGFKDGDKTEALFGFLICDMAIDSSGVLYVADYNNHRIRKVTPDGYVTTLAGGEIGEWNGVGTNAEFRYPMGITINSSGIVFVADNNNRIRKITPDGTVSYFSGTGELGFSDSPARYWRPQGLTIDSLGNIYVADSASYRVRKITPYYVGTLIGSNTTSLTGSTSRIQGNQDGLGKAATLGEPQDVAVDSSFNVYVTDNENCNIRKIQTRE